MKCFQHLVGEARFYDRPCDGLDLTSVAAADLAHGHAQLALKDFSDSEAAPQIQSGQSTVTVLPARRSRPTAPGG